MGSSGGNRSKTGRARERRQRYQNMRQSMRQYKSMEDFMSRTSDYGDLPF